MEQIGEEPLNDTYLGSDKMMIMTTIIMMMMITNLDFYIDFDNRDGNVYMLTSVSSSLANHQTNNPPNSNETIVVLHTFIIHLVCIWVVLPRTGKMSNIWHFSFFLELYCGQTV